MQAKKCCLREVGFHLLRAQALDALNVSSHSIGVFSSVSGLRKDDMGTLGILHNELYWGVEKR